MGSAGHCLEDQNKGGIWIVDTREKAEKLLPYLYQADAVGLDTETVGVDPRSESPVGKGRIACWSLAFVRPRLGLHSQTGRPLSQKVFLWEEALPWFTEWLEDYTAPKVLHNGFTFDRHIFLNHGVNLQGIVGDTLRMSKLIHASKTMNHGLKALMWHLLGYKYGEYAELFSRPRHAPKAVQWYKTTKGEKVPVEGKYTLVKRPGGEDKIKVWKHSGEFYQVYASKELIPLDTVRRDYPQRLETLYEYATLDAKACLELYYIFKDKLEAMEWRV